jgi:hypothetical protein
VSFIQIRYTVASLFHVVPFPNKKPALRLSASGEDPSVIVATGAGTEAFPPGICSGGGAGVTAGAGAVVNIVGTDVVVPAGVSGSIHPAAATSKMKKHIKKIPVYFIVYPLPASTKT